MQLSRPSPLLPLVKLKLGSLTCSFHPLLILCAVAILATGCRCPWTHCNAQLNDSSRWLQSGIEAFHDGDHREAEKLLGQAIESRSGDPILREHLANIYLEQGKTSEAIAELMQATEIAGENAGTYVKIGQIYLGNGQLIPARQFAAKALETDRNNPEGWVLNADIELAKGHLNQALIDYQRALSLKPDFPRVQLKVAEVHRLSGRPMRAFSTVEHMLSRLAPNEQPEEALLLAGRLLIEMNQPSRAVAKLNVATQKSGASSQAFLQLANAQLVLGRNLEAQQTLATAERRFPQNPLVAKRIQEFRSSNERLALLDSANEQQIR